MVLLGRLAIGNAASLRPCWGAGYCGLLGARAPPLPDAQAPPALRDDAWEPPLVERVAATLREEDDGRRARWRGRGSGI